MPGSPALKKRCRKDESLNAQESVIEAASALTVLAQSPPASPHASGSEDGNESSDSEASSEANAHEDEAATKTGASTPSSSAKDKSTVSFPEKLMEILTILESESSDGTMSDQPISWLPGGDGFLISDPNEFTLKVLPRFFSQRVEFSSFTRKLYWWGFRKVTRGAGTDAFHHDCFLKTDPALCRKIKGKPRRKPAKSLSKQAIAQSQSKSSNTASAMNVPQPQRRSQSQVVSSFPPAGTPVSASNVLPIHKNLAFGAVASPTGQANASATNLLLNNSSPLIAAAALRLQQQQQQQNAQAAATRAAIQQLVLNHASVTNQALAVAAAGVQQPQFQQPTQQLNVAAYLASLQRGGAPLLAQPGIAPVAPQQQMNMSPPQQIQGMPLVAAAPVPSIQLPVAAAAPVAAPVAAPAPGSQIVIHVHHMPDGSVRFTQGHGPNANSA